MKPMRRQQKWQAHDCRPGQASEDVPKRVQHRVQQDHQFRGTGCEVPEEVHKFVVVQLAAVRSKCRQQCYKSSYAPLGAQTRRTMQQFDQGEAHRNGTAALCMCAPDMITQHWQHLADADCWAIRQTHKCRPKDSRNKYEVYQLIDWIAVECGVEHQRLLECQHASRLCADLVAAGQIQGLNRSAMLSTHLHLKAFVSTCWLITARQERQNNSLLLCSLDTVSAR